MTHISRAQHGRTPSAVDVIRNRVSDPQRSRLAAMSRPSPLSRGYHTSSSPAPLEDGAHIPTQERQENDMQGFNPFRLSQSEATRMKGNGNSVLLKQRKSLQQRLDSSDRADTSASGEIATAYGTSAI